MPQVTEIPEGAVLWRCKKCLHVWPLSKPPPPQRCPKCFKRRP